jgi:hypothetical protein
MEPNVSVLERAFALARSGKCVSVGHVKQRLLAEGYFASDIVGAALHRQLAALIQQARGTASPFDADIDCQ